MSDEIWNRNLQFGSSCFLLERGSSIFKYLPPMKRCHIQNYSRDRRFVTYEARMTSCRKRSRRRKWVLKSADRWVKAGPSRICHRGPWETQRFVYDVIVFLV